MDTEAATSHNESHSDHSAVVSDVIIGFADGLTVPFALTTGLSSVGSLNLVILGGLAKLFAGAISMGLDAREWREVNLYPHAEEMEIYALMAEYELSRDCVRPIVEGLMANESMWVKFMMDFELKLTRPKTSRRWISALSMGLSYFLGGLVPMIPYFAHNDVNHALFTSIGVTILLLIAFGYIKAIVTGCTRNDAVISSVQTLCIGVMAASTSYGIVRGFNQIRPVHV